MTERNSVECNSYETHNIQSNFGVSLSDHQQHRLKKINETKSYFVAEIKERGLMSKRLSKYIASFDYFDKSLIALSVTTGSISISSFATVIGTPVEIISASFSLAFSISTGIIKKLLKERRNKEKKHNNIVIQARSKLSRIKRKNQNDQYSKKELVLKNVTLLKEAKKQALMKLLHAIKLFIIV